MPLVAQGGTAWLATSAAITAVAVLLAAATQNAWLIGLAAALVAGTSFLLWFFRDPERSAADELASPADGKVVRIDTVEDPDMGTCDRLCIFMSPLDVHVNRFPADGTVLSVTHIVGGHIPAFDKDSDRNERVVTHLKARHSIKIVQIAGAVARRIVPYVTDGQVSCGQRMGMIRLGSRCDILVPAGTVQWRLRVGDVAKAGTTRLAEWRAP